MTQPSSDLEAIEELGKGQDLAIDVEAMRVRLNLALDPASAETADATEPTEASEGYTAL